MSSRSLSHDLPDTLPEMLRDIGEFVACESPSGDLAAVARSADVVAAVGTRRLGRPPERIVIDGCTHLRWSFGEGPSQILLLAHHDTVWPIGSLATRPFEVVDGVMRGPGCFDMSTGLVMAIHALSALGCPDGVTLLVTGDEEIGSPTSRSLIEREAVGRTAVLVLEASADGGALKTARKGVSMYELIVQGRAAHAGLEPERGVNATLELAHQVCVIAGMGDVSRGTSVTPTVASSGSAGNTVPSDARLSIDVRAWDGAEQDRVDRAMRGLRPHLEGARLQVEGGPNRPPMEPAASAGLYAIAGRLAHGLGLSLEHVAVGGGSDGNFTAGVGAPTLDGLGAVGGGAHADDEHVVVGEIVPRTRLLGALVDDLLRGPGRSARTNGSLPTGASAP